MAEVNVWLQLTRARLASKALGSVPLGLILKRPHSENGISGNRVLTLSEVFDAAERVVGHIFHVLDSLLDNHCLGEHAIETLAMNSAGSAMRLHHLAKAKSVGRGLHWPLISPLALNSGADIAVRFGIERSMLRGFSLSAFCREK